MSREYSQARVERACDTCGRIESMVRRTTNCARCRIEAHRVWQLAYSHKNRDRINAKNSAYYHEHKVLKRPKKAVEPPPAPQVIHSAAVVEAALRANKCGRHPDRDGRHGMCQECAGTPRKPQRGALV